MSGRRRGRGRPRGGMQSFDMADMQLAADGVGERVINMHPLRRSVIQLCFLINTTGAFLLSVGWWKITGSALDGALVTAVILCGFVGIILTSMNRE